MRAWRKSTYKTVQYDYVKSWHYADYHHSFQHIHYVLFHFCWLSVLYGCLLQIVTFAGIYMKLGDLMSMFSLQANDTQQVGRRIMRKPYMFLSRRARRLERKIEERLRLVLLAVLLVRQLLLLQRKKQTIQNRQA